MPNWCNNRLIVSGDAGKLKDFLTRSKNKEGEFTFNGLYPIPESLHITSGSNVSSARDVINAEAGDWSGVDEKLDWTAWTTNAGINLALPLKQKRKAMLSHMKKALSEKDMQEGRQSFENEKLYGCKDWYDWCVKNWGTKWDAGEASIYEHSEEEAEIVFDTAWGPPIEWVKIVELKYPDLRFELHYDEPGMGFKGVYSNGKDKCIEY